jgi:hypothetical protein
MDLKTMVFLGACHGLNPGMGWLFAVALGMQQGRALGVWRALPPIAVGHALSVGVVVFAARLAALVVPMDVMKPIVAAMLMALGLYRLWRHRHPRFGGMQVGFRDLTIWSFLMASAHGAGFMVLPFLLPPSEMVSAAGHQHHMHAASAGVMSPAAGAASVAVHTLAYFTVMALAALLVYHKLGLGLLRRGWLNVDWLWAGALVVVGLVVLVA